MLQTTTALLKDQRIHKESTNRLYDAIRNEYHRLKKVEKFGFQFYHDSQILAMIADKFFKSPKTVENIVFYRV